MLYFGINIAVMISLNIGILIEYILSFHNKEYKHGINFER